MKTRSHLILVLGLLLPFAAARISAQYQYPFQNPDLPLEERVNNIVSLMTLDEKVALLSQRPGVPRLGIRSMMQVEGLHGVRAGGAPTLPPTPSPSAWARLGIPTSSIRSAPPRGMKPATFSSATTRQQYAGEGARRRSLLLQRQGRPTQPRLAEAGAVGVADR